MERFNGLPADEAEKELLTCCASPAFAQAVAGGRPYPDRDALIAAADAALRALTWADVSRRAGRAPADRRAPRGRRPRVGLVAAGAVRRRRRDDRAALAGQPGVRGAVRPRLPDLRDRQDRAEVLAAARARLGNDDATERAVVHGELRKIALLRLERLVP